MKIISILALTLFSGYTEYGLGKEFFFSIITIISVVIATVLLLRFSYMVFWWFPEVKKYLIPEKKDDKHDQDIRFSITSLLILVGVILDTLQQIESHLLMRHYDGLLSSGRIKGRSGNVSAY